MGQQVLELLGGEAGCRRLAQGFYGRVAHSEALRPLFPGKSLRCASEELAAFLIQFLGGDEAQTQYRWWLSLRESHRRFKISEPQRGAWLALMGETIEDVIDEPAFRPQLRQFFRAVSEYLVGVGDARIEHPELADHWVHQRVLEQLVDDLSAGRDEQAIGLARHFLGRQSVLVGILAKMMEAGRESLVAFVVETSAIAQEGWSNGRTLLHFSAGYGCLPVVEKLLALGVDPNILDTGGHSSLYRAAGVKGDAAVVRALVDAGGIVDQAGGVSRSTPLHVAARFGNVAVAEALLAAGADTKLKDKNGFTAYDRAVRCRRNEVAKLLSRSA